MELIALTRVQNPASKKIVEVGELFTATPENAQTLIRMRAAKQVDNKTVVPESAKE